MKISPRTVVATLLMALFALSSVPRVACAQSMEERPGPAPTLLGRDQASAMLPPTVFFRGQNASIQGRNSAGLRMNNGKLVLFGLVDTAGYSSALQQTYQAYLITEVPLSFAGKRLEPGAYGFGFVAGERMVVMDIGGNERLSVATTRDESLARPNPLQVLPDASSRAFRLYLGRNYVPISLAE